MPDSYHSEMQSRAHFEAMYEAHCGAVRTFVHRRVPPSAADDVVADVFVAAWRRRERVPADELTWLYGIARGVMANRRRGEARRDALHERLAATAVPENDHGPEPAGEESRVLVALAGLSERDQELLRLVAWEGLDRTRASQVLGISPSLFSLRLHRARRRLTHALVGASPAAQDPDPDGEPASAGVSL